MKTFILSFLIICGSSYRCPAQTALPADKSSHSGVGAQAASSAMKIYVTNPFYTDSIERMTRTAFLDLSESYAIDEEAPLISPEDFDKDTINISSAQKARLLEAAGILETDTVFIYDFRKDTVYKYTVSELPAIACINIYAMGEGEYHLGDYEYGLDLGRRDVGEGENFTFVGSENPFQTGRIKPIVWKRIARKAFPVKLKPEIIEKGIIGAHDFFEYKDAYRFTYGELDYYLQELKRISEAPIDEEEIMKRYLVVINSKTKKVLFEELYSESEGVTHTPLILEQEDSTAEEYEYMQWTGCLFKGKSAMIYGLYYISFGCPDIQFVDKKDPPITILCDNRH